LSTGPVDQSVDNALSFQKKRNETTGLGRVPAVRASCFVARLPVGALDGEARPVRASSGLKSGRYGNRPCQHRGERRRSLFAGYFTDFDTGGN
jgi:hypothetical protein